MTNRIRLASSFVCAIWSPMIELRAVVVPLLLMCKVLVAFEGFKLALANCELVELLIKL